MGCSRNPTTQSRDGTRTVAQSKAKQAIAPITDDDVTEFGNALVRAVNGQDISEIDRQMDWGAMIERSTEGVDAPANLRKAFFIGSAQGLNSDANPVRQICTTVAGGGQFTFARSVRRGSAAIAQFRLLYPEGGVNYYFIELRKQASDQAVGIDLYTMSSGEKFSQGMRRFYIAAIAELDRSWISRLTGEEQALVKHGRELAAMGRLLREGRFLSVLDIYSALPDELRSARHVQLIRIQAAQKTDDKTYLASLEKYRRDFPTDPSVDLISFDYYMINARYGDAIAAINRITESTGDDAYLDSMRAIALLRKSELQSAREAAEKACLLEPTLINGYQASLNIAAAERDFTKVGNLLERIEDQFGIDLSTAPECAEFLQSPEGKAWIDARNSN